jgi:hypothetical protein
VHGLTGVQPVHLETRTGVCGAHQRLLRRPPGDNRRHGKP